MIPNNASPLRITAVAGTKLADQLLIIALVSRRLANQLIISDAGRSFSNNSFPKRAYPVLAQASLGYPELKVTVPRVTRPSALALPFPGCPAFDLHVLSLPLAFVLSQDQTLNFGVDLD